MDFQQFQFDAKISHGCSGEFRIWIPKEVLSNISKEVWVINSVKIQKGSFMQTLSKRPMSKTGGTKRYIPIYNADVMADYSQFGKMHIEITVPKENRGRMMMTMTEECCENCIRWYKNAPDYGLGVTEWICDRTHHPDDTCTMFIAKSQEKSKCDRM